MAGKEHKGTCASGSDYVTQRSHRSSDTQKPYMENVTQRSHASNDVQKSYISNETIFIDASIVRRVKRKALQMQGQLSLHFVGRFYQQCLEELGLWDVDGI